MRVLVTSTPGTGHLHPLVPLARELVLAGHEVVWATAPASCATVESFGFRAVSSGLDTDIRFAMFAGRAADMFALPPRERRAVTFSVLFGEIAAPAMHDDLVELVDALDPQLVVHDFAELAAAPIATARGIPHVSVGFSGAVSDEVQVAAEERVAPVWEREGLSVTSSGFNGDLLLHPFPTLLDTPRTDGPSAPMRPLSFDGAAPRSRPDWIASFGAARPGVYVTFGTEIAQFAPWGTILDALAELDVDVIATVGGQLDPATFAPIAPNTHIEQYVPQSFLLDHAKIVVSHAGAGTLIAAASAGKVQLCIPIAADQWENADSLATANAGVTLEPDDRDVDSIRRSVDHLLVDVSMQTDAVALSDHFAAMPHPADLIPELERLV